MPVHRSPAASAEPDTPPGPPMPPAFQLALEASFGTVAHWRGQFAALGRQIGAGPGRLLLVFQPADGRLVNQTGADPSQAAAGGVPLLALDIGPGQGEPGGPFDPGAAAGAAIDVEGRLSRTDWFAVHGRYQQAVLGASEPFGAGLDETAGALLLDVRRAGVFDQAPSVIPGARWCDPATVDAWGPGLPAGQRLVLYCVHGHEVSRAAVLRLRAAGLDARFLRGGIAAWQAAGQPLREQPKS